MRILVTGPRGFVGARIMDELGQEAIPAPSLRSVDEEGVRRIVDAAQPDLIIHTAAMSDIGTCEQNPEGSYRANVEIPVWLARTGIKCVMFSTDQVYSGCTGRVLMGKRRPRLPIYIPATNWRWSSGRWTSIRIRSFCARPGCMTCPDTVSPTGATSWSICCARLTFPFLQPSTGPSPMCVRCPA